MQEKFSVVLTGKLADGYDLPQVKENIAQAFKLAPEQVDKLFSGKPVALKRGVSKAQAMKLRNTLARAGALGLIKADVVKQPAVAGKAEVGASTKPQPAKTPVSPAPAAKTPAQALPSVTCPRCGHEQAHTTSCGLCKMDLSLHLQRLARRQQLVANRKQLKSQQV
jgi:hypothetical protein